MADEHEYTQFQCERCGFRTRSPDRSETIAVAQGHGERQHDESWAEGDIEPDLHTLELEGFAENP
jgi:hypothetical protein